MFLRVSDPAFALTSPPDACPSLDDMGQAALDFVQRFDMQRVLGAFDRELRELAGERPGVGRVEVRFVAQVGKNGPAVVSDRR